MKSATFPLRPVMNDDVSAKSYKFKQNASREHKRPIIIICECVSVAMNMAF